MKNKIMIKAYVSAECNARIKAICEASDGLTPSEIFLWGLERFNDVEPKRLDGASKKTIRIYLSRDQRDRLRRIAKERGASASSIIRGILENALSGLS